MRVISGLFLLPRRPDHPPWLFTEMLLQSLKVKLDLLSVQVGFILAAIGFLGVRETGDVRTSDHFREQGEADARGGGVATAVDLNAGIALEELLLDELDELALALFRGGHPGE